MTCGILKRKLNQRSEVFYRKNIFEKSFRSLKIEWIRYNSPAFKEATQKIIDHYEMKLKVKSLEGFIINRRVEAEEKKK